MDNKLLLKNTLNLEIKTFKDYGRTILDELAEDYSNNSANYLNFNDNFEVMDRLLIKAFRMLETSEYKLISESTEFLKWLNEINDLSDKNNLFIVFDLDSIIDEFRDVYSEFLLSYEEDDYSSYVDDYSYDVDGSW